MVIYFIVYSLMVLSIANGAKPNVKSNAVQEMSDPKEWKKLLRTKTNVLALFVSSPKQASGIIRTFNEAAEQVKGHGTMVFVDCSSASKLCKQLKASTDSHTLRHYKDGEFHKVYDRKVAASSIVNFMRDPTGDVPWDEDESIGDVVHLPDVLALVKLLKKEPKPVMIMFYAPWCGFCKKMKPDYAAAASELKDVVVFAAIDVNRPENQAMRSTFNISGFPTVLYFKNGIVQHTYEGNNRKDDLVRFAKDPDSKPPKEVDWADAENDVIHLTSENFNETLTNAQSAVVMFYAPWCGHCKNLKPKYEKAATELLSQKVDGILAALDATKYPDVGKRFEVKGYPTMKYFKKGELVWDVSRDLREADALVRFMKNPTEPAPPPPPEPEWEEEPSEVIHLNIDTFKSTLKKKKHSLVMFYAPWCGHCKRAKPEFTAAAKHFEDNPRITLAALDCTKHQSVCKAVGVDGYPTFKYFSYYDRDMKDYSGGREKSDFINFLIKMESDSSAAKQDNTITGTEKHSPGIKISAHDKKALGNAVNLNDADFPSNMEKHNLLMVLFHDDTAPSEAAKAEFVKAADASKSVVLGVVNSSFNKKITKKYGVSRFPSIKIFRRAKFVTDYTGAFTAEKILNFGKSLIAKKDEL